MILSFVIMSLIVAGMAIGVILGRAPIKGSCGGLNNVGIDSACDICGGSGKQKVPAQSTELAYDASKPRASVSR